MTARLIQTPPGTYFVAIREEYVGICQQMKDPKCAAAILNSLERWTANHFEKWQKELKQYRDSNGRRKIKQRLWVWMSVADFQAEFLGLFGETKIRTTLNELVEAGLIRRRNNPNNQWDRTYQYLFRVNIIQPMIDAWASSNSRLPFRKSTASKRQNYQIEAVKLPDRGRKSTEAIPQSPSQKPTTESTSAWKTAPTNEYRKGRERRHLYFSNRETYSDGSPVDPVMVPALIDRGNELFYAWLDALQKNNRPHAGDPRQLWEDGMKTLKALVLHNVEPQDITRYVTAMYTSDDFWKQRFVAMSLDSLSKGILGWKAQQSQQTTTQPATEIPEPPPQRTLTSDDIADIRAARARMRQAREEEAS